MYQKTKRDIKMTETNYLPEGSLLHTANNALALSSRESLERAMNEFNTIPRREPGRS